MPAIEFSRLRTKIELLGRVFASPGQFVKNLSDLYFFYSDMTFQPTGLPTTGTLSSYRAPVVINRELERLLKPYALAAPESTFQIADLLWQTKKLEPCQLAAGLVGALPIEEAAKVLEWIQARTNGLEPVELTSLLHEQATRTIRSQQPGLWVETLATWYASGEPARRKMAIFGLVPLINDENFDNLPIVFNFLEPIFAQLDSQITAPLLLVLERLVEKSEVETLFLVKQALKRSVNENLPRLVRRALPLFSPEGQASLKMCLRENQR